MLRRLKAEDAKKIGKECGLFTLEKFSYSPFFGHPVDMGLIGSEITEFCSEKNKISSTLFKFSSEIKNFYSELFFSFSEVKICTSKQPANTDE